MKKRILSAFIAVLLLVGLFPISTLAVTATPVNSVSAYNVTEPKVGDYPTYTADIGGSGFFVDTNVSKYTTETKDYFIYQYYYVYKGMGWYDETAKNWMYTDQFFQSGRRYTLHIYLTAEDGYEFDQTSISAKINSKSANVTYDEKDPAHSIVITYTFDCEATNVSLIMLNNVNAPVAGESPVDYSISPAYPDYYQIAADHGVNYINGIRWMDESGKQLTNKSTFVEGQRYRIQIAVVPAQNHGYNVCDFIYGLEAQINGKYVVEGGGLDQWDSVYVSSTRLVYIYYTLPAAVASGSTEPDPEPEESTVIETIDISGVSEPIAFDAPVFDASVDDDAKYRVWTGTELYPGMENGVIWMNTSDDMPVRPDTGRFIADKIYTVAVFLEADEGLTFANDGSLCCTVNGESAEAFFYGDNPRYVCVYKDYYVEPAVITEVELEIPVPVVGEIPANYALADNPTYFTGVYLGEENPFGVMWEDLTDGFEGTLTESDTFKSGHEYRVSVCVEAFNGCRFNIDESGYLSISAYVNGEEASALSSDSFPSDRYAFVVFDFAVEGEIEEKIVLGDADGDGKVNGVDSLLAKRIAAGILTPTTEQEKTLDVNGDGRLNFIDTNLISRYIAGVIFEF